MLESFTASCTLTFLLVLLRVVTCPGATQASEEACRDRTSSSEERGEKSDRHAKPGQHQSIERDEHPLLVFLLESKKYLPSLAAFAWIMYMDSLDTLGFNHVNRDGERPFYIIWCTSNDEPLQFFCYATRPVTRLFPAVGITCVIIMPIYNLMHLRVRHVLMRRGILVVFGDKKRLGSFMCVLVAIFLFFSFAHLVLKFFFAKDKYCDSGFKCTPERLYDTIGQTGVPIQEESLFRRELKRTLFDFIGPSCIAFVLLAVGSNLTNHTVTIDEFFQANLPSRVRRFRQCIVISEAEAENIVEELVVKPADEHLSTYDDFYDLAIVRGSYTPMKHDDAEKASLFEDLTIGEYPHTVFTMVTTALKHMVFFGWWPEKLLFDSSLVESDDYNFFAWFLAYVLVVKAFMLVLNVFLMERCANRVLISLLGKVRLEAHLASKYYQGCDALFTIACTVYTHIVGTTLLLLAWRLLMRLRLR